MRKKTTKNEEKNSENTCGRNETSVRHFFLANIDHFVYIDFLLNQCETYNSTCFFQHFVCFLFAIFGVFRKRLLQTAGLIPALSGRISPSYFFSFSIRVFVSLSYKLLIYGSGIVHLCLIHVTFTSNSCLIHCLFMAH